MHYPEPIAKLIDAFSRLPGVGSKTAGRLAFHVLRMKEEEVLDFAKALVNVKRNLHFVLSVVTLPTLIHAAYVQIKVEMLPSSALYKSLKIW